MLRAEVRGFHSPDVDDLADWVPERADHFAVLVTAFVGPVGSAGSESFDFVVCTPKWLETESTEQPVVLLHHIVVSRYDWSAVEAAIQRIVRATGATWEEMGVRIGRYGR